MVDWNLVISQFVSLFPLPMVFTVEPHPVTGSPLLYALFDVDYHTPDGSVDRRRLRSIGLDVGHITAEAGAVDRLRYWAQVTVLHELDECLLYRGERLWNPHVRQPLPMPGT